MVLLECGGFGLNSKALRIFTCISVLRTNQLLSKPTLDIKKKGLPFPSMNYQKMSNAPMNYQLDQNRAFNYQRQPFSPLPSVKEVKTNGQRVT